MEGFDFKNPDYEAIYRKRIKRLEWLRANPVKLEDLRAFYKFHPADFINDWGMTYDPRLAAEGRGLMPFVLFPKQREWIDKVFSNWLAKRDLLSDKSRDMGLSWLAIGFACTMSLHWNDFRAGFGSRKEDYVDKTGDPKSLFWKGRFFVRRLPPILRPNWIERRDTPHMRMNFPDTGSTISGESGDGIGRGDRTSIYFVDESAHLERPKLVDASLSLTTDVRVDISSVNGTANSFAERRFSGKVDVLTMHWTDDPRKDQAWYEYQKERLVDPVVVAQEIDIDYTASVRGVVIPGVWVRAAVDAHKKLNITPAGRRSASFDVADEGPDLNALAGRHGILLERLEEWSGSGSDLFASTQYAIDFCHDHGYGQLLYDNDGLGANVKGDARVINEGRAKMGLNPILVAGFRGSAGVDRPEAEDVKGRTNLDYFMNRKAQAWWRLRRRFEMTWKAVNGQDFDPDEIISIPFELPLRERLIGELSQPTYGKNGAGKLVINKAPDGTKSPNLADAVMIEYSGMEAKPVVITGGLMGWAGGAR